MSLLTQASLVLTPNAYKANKLYSIIPSSGNGDMTTTRATTATRINSSGLVENVATGIPRVDYTSGVANILLEPQRTNTILNSVWAGGGATPTSFTKSFLGTTTPITSVKNPNVTAYNFNGTSIRGYFYQTQPFTINNVYALSVYVENVTITQSIISIIGIANGTGTSVYYKNNVAISSSTNIESGNTYTIVFTATATTTISEVRFGLGVNGGTPTGDFTLSMPQLEVGSYATSYIPTTTSTVTRNADLITLNNIYTNNFITSAGGTWFVEIDNNFSLVRDAGSNGIFIGDNSNPNNGFRIRAATLSSEKLIIEKVISFTSSLLYTTLTNRIKVAIDWNGTTADIFVNGVKVVTATSFPFLAMQLLSINAIDVPKYIRQIALFPTPLTDAECISLTTL
jgi:hypothetical protein